MVFFGSGEQLWLLRRYWPLVIGGAVLLGGICTGIYEHCVDLVNRCEMSVVGRQQLLRPPHLSCVVGD